MDESEDANDRVMMHLQKINREFAMADDAMAQAFRDYTILATALMRKMELRLASGMPEDEVDEMTKIDMVELERMGEHLQRVLRRPTDPSGNSADANQNPEA